MKSKYILMLSGIALVVGCASNDLSKYKSDSEGSAGQAKPEIIEVFACGDYCPGPEEQYLVKAYKGINNAFDCHRVGGIPYEFVGWGKHFVCRVK